jgi:hypothetical protein
MPYELIQPPFTSPFAEMSKKELTAYFDWFMEYMPIRIELLRKLPDNGKIDLNFDPESLHALGRWFAAQVETRPKAQKELDKVPVWVKAADCELTDRTFSLAMDVGFYFAEVMKRKFPQLTWSQNKTARRFIDYGQPILLGFGKVPMNPVRLLVVLAYGISQNRVDGKRLFELYDIWSGKAENNLSAVQSA